MKDWQTGALVMLLIALVLGTAIVYTLGRQGVQRELLMEGYELTYNEGVKPGHGRWVVVDLGRRDIE